MSAPEFELARVPADASAVDRMSTARRFVAALASVRVAILLIAATALISIAGTLIPQQAGSEEYVSRFGASGARFISIAGLSDLYHSTGFVALLALLNASLAACVVRRLRANALLFVSATRTAAVPRLRAAAGILVHASLVLISIGGLASAVFGYRESVKIEEGTSAALPEPGWQLSLKRFEVERYEDGMRPKDFVSTVQLAGASRPVADTKIRMNEPLVVDSVRIYQTSYGWSRQPDAEFRLPARQNGAKKWKAKFGDTLDLGGGLTARYAGFVLDLGVEDGGVVERSDEPNNPAALVTFERKGKSVGQRWIFSKYPDFDHGSGDAPLVRLGSFAMRRWSGLQVVRDPGQLPVWIGCGLLCLGLLLGFYVVPRLRT